MAAGLCWNTSTSKSASSIFGEHRLLESSSLNRIKVCFSLLCPLGCHLPSRAALSEVCSFVKWQFSSRLVSIQAHIALETIVLAFYIVKIQVKLCFEHPYLLAAVDIHSLRALWGSVFPSLERNAPLCGMSFCFDVSMLLPPKPCFCWTKRDLVTSAWVFHCPLEQYQREGGHPWQSPQWGGGETYVSTADFFIKKEGEKTFCNPFCPPGVSIAKNIGTLELKCSWFPVYVIDTSALSELQYGCNSFMQPVEMISTAYQDCKLHCVRWPNSYSWYHPHL